MHHRLMLGRSRGAAMAMTTILLSSSQQQARTEPATSPSDASASSRVAAAFVQQDGRSSLDALRKAYAGEELAKLQWQPVEQPKLVLAYAPMPLPVLAKVASQLSRPVDLRVLALVSDEHLQVAVVEVIKHLEGDDGGIPPSLLPGGTTSVLHIAVARSSTQDDARYGDFYGHALVDRVRRASASASGGKLASLDKAWSGVLPAELGFEKTRAELVPVSQVDRAQFQVSAMVCISDQWANDKCGEPQCGFCRFMKLGPCGNEFELWEACVAQHRDSEEDFVEKCGQQTWDMKECVDKHPDYYMSVMDGEEDEDEEQQTQEEQGADELIEVALVPEQVTIAASAALIQQAASAT